MGTFYGEIWGTPQLRYPGVARIYVAVGVRVFAMWGSIFLGERSGVKTQESD